MKDINIAKEYNKLAKYYDSYVSSFKEDLSLYKSFCDRKDKILEVGCGTGRVLKYLLDNGVNDITGVDISEEMLNIAQAKLMKYMPTNNLCLKKHDFSSESIRKNFDKAFVTYHTFNYILKKPIKFLKNIYLSMGNDSLIIMDLFYPLMFLEPESDGVWIEKDVKLESNETIRLSSKKSFDDTFEHRTLVFAEGENSTTIETVRRFYPKEEIESMLHDVGFRNIKAIYGYSLGDISRFAEDYPLRGYNEFNIDLEEYANREEGISNFVIYGYKSL
jgi:ubiquinone/menaquinone biosynthesis C-methylase UbiE